MSFTDPQTVTIGADTISLPRVSTGDFRSKYQSADGRVVLTASSQYGNRIRRVLRLDHSKVSDDEFRSDIDVERSMSCYLVFDLPKFGYSPTEAKDIYLALKGQMTASSDALVAKLLGGES